MGRTEKTIWKLRDALLLLWPDPTVGESVRVRTQERSLGSKGWDLLCSSLKAQKSMLSHHNGSAAQGSLGFLEFLTI